MGVGACVCSKQQGYKSVTWTLGRGKGGSSTTPMFLGVVAHNVPHTFEWDSVSEMCEHAGFFGWHSEHGLQVIRGRRHPVPLAERVRSGEQHNNHIFHGDSARAEVRLDFETGQLTCTRLTKEKQTHTIRMSLPVNGGQGYRLCMDMSGDACVDLVECVAELA
eukprot:GDKI01032448.1.p1 GENE.GDKI01032448.1~~GDKI01032448.1.p1  ORF type:complete len:163 (-),score=42.60 GDKI01032448.1:241-729(-)